MLLSQRAEYALRATVWLARGDGRSYKTAEIASNTQVPPSYLSKVLQSLARAGLVVGTRGHHGGFTLARDAAAITVLEVVEAVDPIQRISECPLGLKDHVDLCPLHRKLDQAFAEVERSFAGTTIASLVPAGVAAICTPSDPKI
jgi:Rrf2 family transcriptional regulator, nitric oxide-sensitive transcriptional repressor